MISAVNSNYSTPSFGCIHKPKKGVSKKQVLAGAATVAAITAGVVYRKPIMKFFKEFSFKNIKDKASKFFNKEKPVRTTLSGEMANQSVHKAEGQKVAKETLRLKEQCEAERAHGLVKYVEHLKASQRNLIHDQKQALYEDLWL